MTITLPMMKKALDRHPFQLARGPATARSEQVLGEKHFRTPVHDVKAYRDLQNVRVFEHTDPDTGGKSLQTAVKVFRGLPASFARDLRFQERRYLAGGVYLQPLWKKFFDAIPEMKARRQANREAEKVRICLDMAAANA